MRARRKHRLVPRPVRRSWLSTKATSHEAVAEGATLAAGGGEVTSKTPGHYFAPALFTDVSSQAAVARDEIFGPIAAVLRVPDYDAALTLPTTANSVYQRASSRGMLPRSTISRRTLRQV